MKVLVLGGGYCQLNMIKRLKSRGDYIILADYLADNPGKEYVDEHHMISTFDEPAVTQLAKESGAEAVMTMGTDQPVLTAALTGEKCGLPFYVDSKTAETVTNKRVMKKLFSKNGIPTNAYRLVGKNFHDREIIGLRFPAVLKPVDSQGQRGIFKITDLADIRRHIDETLSFSREGKALLEEYYPNDEITVNGWVNEGKAHIVSVVDRVTMEIGNRIGICICHNYPSLHHTHYKEEINGLTQKIIDVFNIKTGPLYFQYFIGEKSLIVNEIAMRIGGAYEDITIPIISGFDILGKVMDYAETGTSNVPEIIKYDMSLNNKYVSTQLFFIKPGKITKLTPIEDIKAMNCVKDALYIIKEGETMDTIRNATARAGYFVVEGLDFGGMISNVNNVFNKLQLLDENGTNLVLKYGDYGGKYKFV